jgi:hypothetical protein
MARSDIRRIGILTFHRCINYGSYWQARCLVEGLRSRGHDAVLLEHEARDVTWAEWRTALQPLLPEPSPRSDRHLYAIKVRKFLDSFEQLPRSPPFPLNDPGEMGPRDMVVVGSDEVWNLTHPWYGGRALFFGEGLRAKETISYAASFGNYDASAGLGAYWAKRLRGFSALSVRDENSRTLIRESVGHEPAIVLDPVLQFPPSAPAAPTREAPYIAVYGHSFPAWFGRRIRAWAAARSLPLVSVGYRNDWADEQQLTAGPGEFAALITGAAAVATNFFHGCVFALINAKPFAAAPSAYRFNKISGLTALLGADSHLIHEDSSDEAYETALGRPLEAAIGRRIAALRQDSNRFLDRVLT